MKFDRGEQCLSPVVFSWETGWPLLPRAGIVPNILPMSTPDQRAEALGLKFAKPENRPYLNLCVKSGNLLFTSGHVSDLRGKLGSNVSVEDGNAAARDAIIKVLNSVWVANNGTLNGLRVVRLLGCVNAAPDFTDCSTVINGASDFLHEIFGKEDAGYHARSALGFSTLPLGVAVEIEAIFEIVG